MFIAKVRWHGEAFLQQKPQIVFFSLFDTHIMRKLEQQTNKSLSDLSQR